MQMMTQRENIGIKASKKFTQQNAKHVADH